MQTIIFTGNNDELEQIVDGYEIDDGGTGSHEELERYKVIDYDFDKYTVKIKLTQSNEFIGILEIKVNKNFLSHKQRIASQGYHDVEEFYD